MKSKTTAVVLAFLLGGLGVHKFYLGQTGLGVLYLLLSWTFIPALIGLIEALILLGMNDEVFEQKYNPELYLEKINAIRLEREQLKAEAARIEREARAAEQAERARIEAEQKAIERAAHLKAMQEKYGEEDGRKVHQQITWIGMTKEMLIDALGQPKKDKKHLTKKSVKERYYYREYLNEKGNNSYRLEILLEDNEVIGIKEL